MRFTAQIVSLCHIVGFLSLAIASPNGVIRSPPSLVERDVATVTEVLSDVGSGIDKLDSTVKSLPGDPDPVVDAAESLVSVINDGKAKVDKSDDLSLADALALQDPVQDLTKKAETLTENLKAKRSGIQEAGLCSTTRSQVSDINEASQKLIDSVVSKVPEAAQSIAKDLASDLTNVLNEAQDAFSESNCADKEGSSTSKQAGASTTKPATETTDAGNLPSTTEIPTVSTAGSVTLSTESTVVPVGTNTNKPYPPVIPTTTAGIATTTPTPPVVTAGGAVIAPAGALILGMAVVLI
ncbi:hypothetical protein NM208_g998 [Fusarium decemcellulare]|uniref:Uncharacterized protein n=1 Tax=Fusarium decemcellulare TaxID=57161 RepID=A0ACC1SXT2_9HYPO|nr:hypothetical protein NM208_g998 [Fusarium decemcellulare]